MRARYVIEQEVLDLFLQLPVRRRDKMLSVLAQLADHPQPDDPVSHRDLAGRLIRQRTIRGWGPSGIGSMVQWTRCVCLTSRLPDHDANSRLALSLLAKGLPSRYKLSPLAGLDPLRGVFCP